MHGTEKNSTHIEIREESTRTSDCTNFIKNTTKMCVCMCEGACDYVCLYTHMSLWEGKTETSRVRGGEAGGKEPGLTNGKECSQKKYFYGAEKSKF